MADTPGSPERPIVIRRRGTPLPDAAPAKPRPPRDAAANGPSKAEVPNTPPPPAEPASSAPPQQRHVDILAPERERVRGDRPGDRLVRLRRTKIAGVRRLDEGVYEVIADNPPASRSGRLLYLVRRRLLGAPIRSEHEMHERLPKSVGLAAFGTDNISSSAYATEELMRVLMLAGVGALSLTVPLSVRRFHPRRLRPDRRRLGQRGRCRHHVGLPRGPSRARARRDDRGGSDRVDEPTGHT